MLYKVMNYSFKDIVLMRNSGNKKTKNFVYVYFISVLWRAKNKPCEEDYI